MIVSRLLDHLIHRLCTDSLNTNCNVIKLKTVLSSNFRVVRFSFSPTDAPSFQVSHDCIISSSHIKFLYMVVRINLLYRLVLVCTVLSRTAKVLKKLINQESNPGRMTSEAQTTTTVPPTLRYIH